MNWQLELFKEWFELQAVVKVIVPLEAQNSKALQM
jgi:hypothetical protein